MRASSARERTRVARKTVTLDCGTEVGATLGARAVDGVNAALGLTGARVAEGEVGAVTDVLGVFPRKEINQIPTTVSPAA